MADSPTQRTLALLRREGWAPWVVERWNPHSRTRSDAWGVVDVVALGEREVLAVQATSGSNVSKRVDKLRDSDGLAALRRAGVRVEVWGWRKNAARRWVVRRVDVS